MVNDARGSRCLTSASSILEAKKSFGSRKEKSFRSPLRNCPISLPRGPFAFSPFPLLLSTSFSFLGSSDVTSFDSVVRDGHLLFFYPFSSTGFFSSSDPGHSTFSRPNCEKSPRKKRNKGTSWREERKGRRPFFVWKCKGCHWRPKRISIFPRHSAFEYSWISPLGNRENGPGPPVSLRPRDNTLPTFPDETVVPLPAPSTKRCVPYI